MDLALLRRLSVEESKTLATHYKYSPIFEEIPVGGGEWMDSFFRLEGLRGIMSALRAGKSLEASLDAGKERSRIAVRKWNESREYQVHRHVDTACLYLVGVVRRNSRMDGKSTS